MRVKCFSFKLSRQCHKIFAIRFFRKSPFFKHFLIWKLFGFSRFISVDWRKHHFSVYIIVSWTISRRRYCSVIVIGKGWLIAVSLSLVSVIVIRKHTVEQACWLCLSARNAAFLVRAVTIKLTRRRDEGIRGGETGQRGFEGIIFSFSPNNGSKSDPLEIDISVIQGSTLGPISSFAT